MKASGQLYSPATSRSKLETMNSVLVGTEVSLKALYEE
jgi:hypothetical protein